MSDRVVTFGNDEKFRPNLRYRFAEGSALAPSTFPALGEPSSESISNTAASTVAKAREVYAR